MMIVEDNRMRRGFNFLLGVLVGCVIGAAVVMLTAPQSGQETRGGARERLDSILEEGRKAFAARKAELETRMADIQAGQGH